MDYDQHRAALARETDALARAFDGGTMDAPVPTCPDWTLAELADHVGSFTGFWTHVLCEGTGRPKPDNPPRPTDPAAVGDWYRGLADALRAELDATPPGTEIWTWSPTDRTATFAGRRVAHETAIHRFDAQLALGQPDAVDPMLAADGIEEIFVMISAWGEPGRSRDPEAAREAFPPSATGQTIHLHGTDEGRDDEWLLTLGPEGLDVAREHAKGDLAVRGAVSDLELLLYQRPPLGELQRFGDESVLGVFYEIFTFG